MPTVAITEENAEQTVDSEGIVLLDFWADWCGPCHQFAPIYEEASERHPDVTFGKVDVEQAQQLSAEFGVQSIPTLAAIRDRVVVFSQAGVLPGEAIDELIGKVRELDMEQVKTEADGEGS